MDAYTGIMNIIQGVQALSDETEIDDQETSEEISGILQDAVQALYRVSDRC